MTLVSRRRTLEYPNASQGFTLIELMVAVSLAALSLAVVPFAVERMFDGMQYRSTVRDMMSAIRSARAQAIVNGKETVFKIDLRKRVFGVGDSMNRRLPEGLSVRLAVAERESLGENSAGIRFYPDGSSTGGSIEVERAEGVGVRLRVGWLTGRLDQYPL